jgi:ankyrin repeat protein
MIAANNNNLSTVRALIEKGANVNLQNKKGETALLLSCEPQIDNRIAILLLDNGADPNIKDNERFTPLMFACRDENIELVKKFLDNGADPNIKNAHGTTALMISVIKNDLNSATELLKHGANVSIEDKYDMKAIDYVNYGEEEMIKLFERQAIGKIRAVVENEGIDQFDLKIFVHKTVPSPKSLRTRKRHNHNQS